MPALSHSNVHPSLRLKVTLGFVAAMALLLTVLGVFVYDRFKSGLDESLNASLRARTADVQAFVKQADTGLNEIGQAALGSGQPTPAGTLGSFVQVLQPGARVLEQTPGIPHRPLLSARQRAKAAAGPIWMTARPDAAIGVARILVTPVHAQGTPMLVIAGASLHDREAALSRLLAVMILGGPVALLLASLLGYGVATLSLRGVEAMRATAAQLSLRDQGGRLPVPKAADELRRLALTLNEMLDRNEAAFAHERRFVADASHELRSPLTVLKSEIEVALAGKGSAREMRAALTSADCEVDRMSQLASDLLTLAEGDDEELALELSPTSLRDLLQHLRARFELRAAVHGRALLISLADDIDLTADPLRLEQALSNLIENALRHGKGDVTVSAQRNGADLELHVSDEGDGFPEDYLPDAFDRFTRADGARTHEGSGLGLSIVRMIARAHRGDAHIRNMRSCGADVWISLPCEDALRQKASQSTLDAPGKDAPELAAT